jgi:hypothetical protein
MFAISELASMTDQSQRVDRNFLPDPARSEPAYIEAATVFTFCVVSAVLIVSFLRSGLDDSAQLRLGVLSFALVSIWLPVLVRSFALPADYGVSYGVFALVCGIVFPLLGFLLGPLAWLVAAVIVACALIRARRHLKQVCVSVMGLKLAFGGILLSVALIVASSANRLLLPEAVSLGLAHSDSYFHLAIAQMIRFYGVVSIGGDGLTLQRYHFGSHAIAAGLAKAVGTSVPLVYVYWAGLALKIQLLWALVWSTISQSVDGNRKPWLALSFLYPLAFMFLGRAFLESESFLLGMAILVSSTPLASRLVTAADRGCASYRFGLAIMLLVAFLGAIAKVSVGFYGGVILLWVLFAGRRDRLNIVVMSGCLALLGILTLMYLVPTETALTEGGFGVLLASYEQYMTVTTFLSYTIPLAIVFVNVTDMNCEISTRNLNGRRKIDFGISTVMPDRLVAAWHSFRQTDGYVQILGVCLLSTFIVLVTVPIGSNMAYFSGVLFFLAACRLPSFLHFRGSSKVFRRRASAGIVLFLVFLVLFPRVYDFSQDFSKTASHLIRSAWVQSAADSQDEIDRPGFSKAQVMKSFKEYGTVFASLRTALDQTAWAEIMREISLKQGKDYRLAVYVPPSNPDFWRRLQGGSPYWCMSAHLMIPAEIGIPMLRGIGPEHLERKCLPPGLIWYGFGHDQNEHRSQELRDEDVCASAGEHGMDAVYVLRSMTEPGKNRLLDCRSG